VGWGKIESDRVLVMGLGFGDFGGCFELVFDEENTKEQADIGTQGEEVMLAKTLITKSRA